MNFFKQNKFVLIFYILFWVTFLAQIYLILFFIRLNAQDHLGKDVEIKGVFFSASVFSITICFEIILFFLSFFLKVNSKSTFFMKFFSMAAPLMWFIVMLYNLINRNANNESWQKKHYYEWVDTNRQQKQK